jgi:protocatechuate 3,4-dioxygenase beta subunit
MGVRHRIEEVDMLKKNYFWMGALVALGLVFAVGCNAESARADSNNADAPLAGAVGDAGLAIGEYVPAYDPFHVSGPDAGTATCPVCKYINRPMVQVWINGESDENAKKIAGVLQTAAVKYSKDPHDFKGFLVWLINKSDEADTKTHLTDLAKAANAPKVAFAYLDKAEEAVKSYEFPLNGNVRNIVFVYVNRKVVAKYVNFEPNEANLKDLSSKIDKISEKS